MPGLDGRNTLGAKDIGQETEKTKLQIVMTKIFTLSPQ